MYQKALVPLDGSSLAECALSHVKSWAEEGLIGEIILLSVIEVEINRWSELRGIDFDAVKEQLLRKAKEYLTDVMYALRLNGIKIHTVVEESQKPAQAIFDSAQKYSADLIVIATHGNTGIQELMLGSVAFKVLQKSPIPVLLTRPK